ncbi:MAG: class I SAM-dependent methyltransferase [Filomicrobium sp.]
MHLDQDSVLASRPVDAIDRVVDWIDQSLGLDGASVCDLGCGPGLYASKFAERGAIVHGVDFSWNSIDYARKQASLKNGSVNYLVANYLSAPLPEQQDVVTMIYCDFCPLSPIQRQTLLNKIRQTLAPGGKFVFDVFSISAFEGVRERVSFGKNFMDGFWSGNDYFAFQHTFRYEQESVSLDHFTIVEQERTWDVYNWLQYFTPGQLRVELEQAGFRTIEFTEGFGVDRSDPATFGVITGL